MINGFLIEKEEKTVTFEEKSYQDEEEKEVEESVDEEIFNVEWDENAQMMDDREFATIYPQYGVTSNAYWDQLCQGTDSDNTDFSTTAYTRNKFKKTKNERNKD